MEWILWLQSCRPNPVVATLSVGPKRFFDSSPTILHLEPTRFDSPRVSGRNLLPEVQYTGFSDVSGEERWEGFPFSLFFSGKVLGSFHSQSSILNHQFVVEKRRFEKKNRTGRVHVEHPEERGGLAVRSDCFVFHCWHPKMGNLCADDSKLRNVRETKGFCARGNRQQLLVHQNALCSL